jgi:hypothetical protein
MKGQCSDMSGIDDFLAQVDSLIVEVKPVEAEDRMRSLLTTLGPAELRVWEPDLRRTIGNFLPKRRNILSLLLDKLLQAPEQPSKPSEPSVNVPRPSDVIIDELKDDLQDLSEHHIFQWSTFYRDFLGDFFGKFVKEAVASEISTAATSVRQLLKEHTSEVFSKGYLFVTQRDSAEFAISKSINGLQSFLDLPIEFYSARLSADLPRTDAIALRYLTSSMLAGIIEGYASLSLGNALGRAILIDYNRSWSHALAFMTGSDAKVVLSVIDSSDFRAGAIAAILPLAYALDTITESETDYIPLPALSQFVPMQARLDVALRPPPYAPDRRPVEVQCYLDSDLVAPYSLTQAADRGLGAVVAPLRPDTRDFVAADERLSRMVVPASDLPESQAATINHLVRTLEYAIYRRRSPRVGSQPLEYNFAKEFPLHNPFLAVYYHVYRTSVRDLLRTFERRNGVRLWCSVRRSGKTTAGFDLGITTGESNVISQTCDLTEQIPTASLLYDEICSALSRGEQLPSDFLAKAIERCMSAGQTPGHRTVLVLDEYETLFGQLSTAVDYQLRLRYTVVQPLLNQMVSFSRENLIVFLGQQPNAHFILMDQNQLSPYVQQDSFPLFTHAPEAGENEFTELLQKILSNRVGFDRSFANRVFVETAGHPYLTVNLMVEFVDWLIRVKRPSDSLSFTEKDFSLFASRMFRRESISISSEYSFFRDAAIREALSTRGKRRNPWLYAIYSVLRNIALENPESFVCSRAEYVSMVDRLGMAGMGITPDYLLTTGTEANFLSYTVRAVAPKIRLLARIAAVTTPEVNP